MRSCGVAKVERFAKRIVEVIQPVDVVLAEASDRSPDPQSSTAFA